MQMKEFDMEQDIKSILYSQEDLNTCVKSLAARISADYQGKDILLVGVLKGANIFMCDLMREINLPLEIDFIAASSYGSSTKSSGVVKILKDLDYSIEGRDVIIVEDIIDTGLTLNYLIENFKSRGPRSLEICTLLDKPERRIAPLKVKYRGFQIPDEFIVGYGIDFAEKYRNLPYIATLKESVYSK
jgi:hypoxanthine phosphoribosyltransferase